MYELMTSPFDFLNLWCLILAYFITTSQRIAFILKYILAFFFLHNRKLKSATLTPRLVKMLVSACKVIVIFIVLHLAFSTYTAGYHWKVNSMAQSLTYVRLSRTAPVKLQLVIGILRTTSDYSLPLSTYCENQQKDVAYLDHCKHSSSIKEQSIIYRECLLPLQPLDQRFTICGISILVVRSL